MSRTERFFRVALRVASVLSVLCALGFLGTMLHARHEINLTESVVAAHSTMLARDGTLYYDWKTYPYTACGYTPIFYFLEAALVRIGMPGNLGGRSISFLAMLTSVALCWRLVMLYTSNRYAAWLAGVLASSSLPLLMWGTTGVVDMLGATFAVAAFYQFSRFYLNGENALLWAGLLAIAAFFTKQSMMAAPTAMFLLLLFKKPKAALIFGGALGVSIAALAFGINAITSGRFFGNTVFAMIQPFELDKLTQHIQYILLVSGALIFGFAATIHRLIRGESKALLLYFTVASILLCIMAPKTGSDSNYHIEPTLLLIVCTCVGLVELNFFELVFHNSKSWITLLQAPLAIFLVMNYRIIVPELIVRVWRESQFRVEMAKLEPYFKDAHGRIFAADMDPLIYARGRLDVEPIIYALLVKAGRIDPEPLRRDLAKGTLPVVVLYEDIAHPIPDQSLEIGRLLPAHQEEIRQHYHLVEHIPGPYLGGIYVYLPNPR